MIPGHNGCGKYLPSFLRVCDGPGLGWQICLGGLFQMKDKMGILPDVCIPISFAGRAGDVNTAVDLPKPDLDATWLAGFAADGGNVNDLVIGQGAGDLFI